MNGCCASRLDALNYNTLYSFQNFFFTANCD